MEQQLLARLASVPSPAELGLDAPEWEELHSLFEEQFLTLHLASELYTARLCLLLVRDMGWEPKLRAGVTAGSFAAGLPEQARIPLAWMLGFLAEEGLLERDGDSYRLVGEPDLDLEPLRAMAEAYAPGHGPNFDLLDGVRRVIPPFFSEGRPGDQLLFDLSLFPLWLAYFRNDNLIYRTNNLLTVMALREGLAEFAPGGARVLELGAGAGSFAKLLAQDGAARGYLDRIADYRFTDVAPAFLRRAQRELREQAPGLPLSFGPLDLNKDLDAQGLEDASLDIIVGVNVVHVARELPATLAALRRKLRPGGRLVLGECMKPGLDRAIYLEFLFNFMDSFTKVELHPELRPAHGFLTPEVWTRALEHAGFSDIRIHPQHLRQLMDRLPCFFVGSIEARA